MGYTRWDPSAWSAYSSTTRTKSTHTIFTSSHIDKDLDPKNIKLRESRDSAVDPESTAVMVFSDCTGSMGILATDIAQKDLGIVAESLIDRKPITNPQILLGVYGDLECDSSPLQVTQFEVGLSDLTPQLEKLYIESGGGGNGYESTSLAWLFAAQKTGIDCFDKRGKKGYLFTCGDEPLNPNISLMGLKKLGFMGESDLSTEEVFEMASRTWEIYHIVIAEGSHARSHGPGNVARTYANVMGEDRVMVLESHKDLGELIVSTVQIAEGADKHAVASSWSGTTAVVIANATKTLVSKKTKSRSGVRVL